MASAHPDDHHALTTAYDQESIPSELKSLPQWVCWRPEQRKGDPKPTKVPYDPNSPSRRAATDNPDTWASFALAVQVARTSNGRFGIGFVFTERDPYVGIDLDHCRDEQTGVIEQRAQGIINTLESYSEVSPSGTGVKIFCRGAKPEGRHRRSDVEMYDAGRFFTITGDHLPGSSASINERPHAVTEVHREHIGGGPPPMAQIVSVPPGNLQLDDETLIDKAMNSDDGIKFSSLWDGDWQRLGYDSESEADLALCSKLAFWTSGDRQRVDALFRASALYRKKWERDDYRRLTLDKALEGADFYSPPETSRGIQSLGSDRQYKPKAPPWPSPLRQEAYHGITGDVIRAVQPHTEADPAAILTNFLVYAGNVIGRGPHALADGARHGINLFAVHVGETSKARKGSADAQARRLFQQVDSDWAEKRILRGLSSGEGLLWAVRDPIDKIEPVKEDGRPTGEYFNVPADPGVEDKRLLVVETEFASMLKVMKRETSTLSALARQAWDGDTLQTMTKNNPAIATDTHISIIGHITKDELLRSLTDSETANGFANRFLWSCAERSQLLPEGGGAPDLTDVMPRLRDAISQARSVRQIARDAETKEMWKGIYEELSQGRPGLFGAVSARAEAQVLRLSVLYAALDGDIAIRRHHLEAALAVWEYVEASIGYIFGDAIGDPIADSIVGFLSNFNELTRTQISDLFGRNVGSPRISQALNLLGSSGRATMETQVPDGGKGRPSEVWRLR